MKSACHVSPATLRAMPSPPAVPAAPELPGFSASFVGTVVRTGRADGAMLVIPGRLLIEGDDELISIQEAGKLLRGRYSQRQLRRIARTMDCRQRAARCKLSIPLAAVRRMSERRG